MLVPSDSQAVSVATVAVAHPVGPGIGQVSHRLRCPAHHGVGGAKRAHRLGDVVHANHVSAGLHGQHRQREAGLEAVRLVLLTDEHAGRGLP